MNQDWYGRFVDAIRKDGRDLKTISKAAGCGPNYVQQIIKDNKRPTVDRFMAILHVLGSPSALYVLTGHEPSPDDEDFIRLFSGLDPKLRAEAHRFFRALQDRPGTQGPSDEPQN